MDDLFPWLLGLAALVFVTLGVQLVLHRDRWRARGVETAGDYRVAPRSKRGAFSMPWPVVGASALAATWAIATLLFVAAGALLLLVVAEDDATWFCALLGLVLASGLTHAGLLVRAASRLLRRHQHAPRSTLKVAVHGLLHHAAVLALFACWTWLEHRHDVDDTLVVLGPLCLAGAVISLLLVPASRHAPAELTPASA
jgi:hypothetical protein